MMDAVKLIDDMLTYKESIGRKRGTYEAHLRGLAEFLNQRSLHKIAFSINEDILPWCERHAAESASGLRRRMAAVREFTKYLYAMGLCDGILSLDEIPAFPRFVPYIFTDNELISLFNASSRKAVNPKDPFATEIISVVYQLIYFCGLRPNEGRELLRSDFNGEGPTLFIRHNKAGRERIIPIAQDMAEFLGEYLKKRDSAYPYSAYMFPAPDGKPHTAKWLGRHFASLWQIAYPESPANVRVYDPRHRFATTVLTEWLDRGEDFFTALPYLSAYMGHNDFSSTAYYVHLLPERLLKSGAIDWDRFESLLPEVDGYEK